MNERERYNRRICDIIDRLERTKAKMEMTIISQRKLLDGIPENQIGSDRYTEAADAYETLYENIRVIDGMIGEMETIK